MVCPNRPTARGDRATNLQNLSTLEQTSRHPTIWIRQRRQRINFEATEHLDQTVAATYQLWSRHRGNRKSGSDGGGNVSTLEQTWRQPKKLDQTVAATYQLWSRHGGNRKIWIRPWRQLSCLRPSCVSFFLLGAAPLPDSTNRSFLAAHSKLSLISVLRSNMSCTTLGSWLGSGGSVIMRVRSFSSFWIRLFCSTRSSMRSWQRFSLLVSPTPSSLIWLLLRSECLAVLGLDTS